MRFGKINKVLLFGGGQLLAEFSLQLARNNIEIHAVVSARHCREDILISGKRYNFKQFLDKNKISYHVSPNVNTDKKVINLINDKALGISMGAAWIFKDSFIRRFRGRLVNVHGTRLPQNRGGGGFSWQILRNNRLGFCLLHQIDPGIDTGVIVKYKEFLYPPSCRIPREYSEIYIAKAMDFLKEFLREIKNNTDFALISQQEYFSIFWPRLATKIHGFIDWSWPLRDIESFICAFDEPYSGASTFIKNKKVFLKGCFSDFNDGAFHPFQKGIVYRKTNQGLFIAAGEGALVVASIIDEEGRDMADKVQLGDRFYTNVEFLDQAKSSRIFYSSI